jgi:hypothetical protein
MSVYRMLVGDQGDAAMAMAASLMGARGITAAACRGPWGYVYLPQSPGAEVGIHRLAAAPACQCFFCVLRHLQTANGLFLVTQEISPRHQQHSEGAPRGEGRARASSGTRRGHPNPLWARCD